MATKTLTITEEAYDRLRAHKREGESFTDVVLRLTRADRDVWVGCGAWTGTGLWEAVEAGRHEIDEGFEEREDARSR